MNPVRQPLWWMRLATLAAAMSVIVASAAVAADTAPPTAGREESVRLACVAAFDEPAGNQAPVRATSEERGMIINRCLAQTGEFGAAVARACAEKDLASFEALLAYPEACAPFVVRCAKRVGQHSWGMVKICVDREIGREQGSKD